MPPQAYIYEGTYRLPQSKPAAKPARIGQGGQYKSCPGHCWRSLRAADGQCWPGRCDRYPIVKQASGLTYIVMPYCRHRFFAQKCCYKIDLMSRLCFNMFVMILVCGICKFTKFDSLEPTIWCVVTKSENISIQQRDRNHFI